MSSSQNASNQSPKQDCCMEILKTEYADLLSQLSEAKDAIISKDLLIENLQRNNSEVDCQVNVQVEPAELPCLHDILPSNAVASVLALNLGLTKTGSRGFMLGLDSNDRPIIKHVEQNVPLKKGDRILEVNRCNVLHLSESQLYKHLNSVEDGLKIVVLRLPDSKQRHSSEDIDSLKEDLTLALMELETVQQENKDLSNELNRLRKNCEELDNDESFDVFDRNDD